MNGIETKPCTPDSWKNRAAKANDALQADLNSKGAGQHCFLLGLLQFFRLGGLPFFLADPLDRVQMNEGAFFVADHDVERAIAVDIACGDLGADAGIVIDLMRDVLDSLSLARELEPVEHGWGVGFLILLWAMRPEAFASDYVE